MTRRTLAYGRLASERVELQPVRTADAAALFPLIHRCESVLRWLIWTGPATTDELARRFATWHLLDQENEYYIFAIRERATRAVCGTISLRFFGNQREADLGYWIGEEYWGRGVGSEAVALVCWLAFRHLGAERASATVFEGNTGSRVVLERSGFRLEDTLRDVLVGPGRSVDEWLFRVTRAEWELVGGEPVLEELEFEDDLLGDRASF